MSPFDDAMIKAARDRALCRFLNKQGHVQTGRLVSWPIPPSERVPGLRRSRGAMAKVTVDGAYISTDVDAILWVHDHERWWQDEVCVSSEPSTPSTTAGY